VVTMESDRKDIGDHSHRERYTQYEEEKGGHAKPEYGAELELSSNGAAEKEIVGAAVVNDVVPRTAVKHVATSSHLPPWSPEQAVESAVLLSEQTRPLMPRDFLLEGPGEGSLPELWRREREAIIEVLQRKGFNRSIASRELGMSRKTLYNKMKRYAIP
jgi:DNA-binding NtrC family response regulator